MKSFCAVYRYQIHFWHKRNYLLYVVTVGNQKLGIASIYMPIMVYANNGRYAHSNYGCTPILACNDWPRWFPKCAKNGTHTYMLTAGQLTHISGQIVVKLVVTLESPLFCPAQYNMLTLCLWVHYVFIQYPCLYSF